LRDEHKIRLCEICTEVRADFVKTSTGFAETGATVHDVQLMRKYCPLHIQVKAAGGIRTLEQFLQMKAAGANRIGVSATAKILETFDVQNSR
jgi:deoxyribose-phosphate aldolase